MTYVDLASGEYEQARFFELDRIDAGSMRSDQALLVQAHRYGLVVPGIAEIGPGATLYENAECGDIFIYRAKCWPRATDVCTYREGSRRNLRLL